MKSTDFLCFTHVYKHKIYTARVWTSSLNLSHKRVVSFRIHASVNILCKWAISISGYKYATHLGHQYIGAKTKVSYINVGFIMLGLFGRMYVGFHYYVNIAWCLNLELKEIEVYTQTIALPVLLWN